MNRMNCWHFRDIPNMSNVWYLLRFEKIQKYNYIVFSPTLKWSSNTSKSLECNANTRHAMHLVNMFAFSIQMHTLFAFSGLSLWTEKNLKGVSIHFSFSLRRGVKHSLAYTDISFILSFFFFHWWRKRRGVWGSWLLMAEKWEVSVKAAES